MFIFQVAYTFDAGPNATLFLLEKDVSKVLGFLDYYFPAPASAGVEYKKGIAVQSQKASQVRLFLYCSICLLFFRFV